MERVVIVSQCEIFIVFFFQAAACEITDPKQFLNFKAAFARHFLYVTFLYNFIMSFGHIDGYHSVGATIHIKLVSHALKSVFDNFNGSLIHSI